MALKAIQTAHGACIPDLGLRMRVLREMRGLSQTALAERTGVHQPEISKFEGGFALHRLILHADALAIELGEEVHKIAELARQLLKVHEIERQLLQAKVNLAVTTIVGKLLLDKRSADEMMEAVTLEAVCAEMGEAVPMAAVEAVPIQMAIRYALVQMADVFKRFAETK